MVSYLLACKQILGSHTADNIYSHYEELVDEYNIRDKLFKIVTDNASNMKKAFKVSLPGFTLQSDEEGSDNDEDEEMSEGELPEEDIQLETLPQRISCFAHSLQLCVKDGLASSQQLTKLLQKLLK